jgi:hypothetical protein
MARLRERERRGWAATLLAWREAPLWLEAEVAACRYFIAPGRHEVLAWGEVRDWGGRYRVELGSFADVAEAQQACEQDAQRRLRREEDAGPVDVRIATRQRSASGG